MGNEAIDIIYGWYGNAEEILIQYVRKYSRANVVTATNYAENNHTKNEDYKQL